MARDVFANGNAVAGKVGGGKVIAAFPDVCMSPPSPPAGPIPLPYPNTSFSKDLKQGSKTVKAGGKPVALEDQSYYKTVPLGDEACTKAFGMSVLSHTNTGKTYFAAYSMDVIFEGKKACRHIDLATSNHASQPPSPPPVPNLETLHPDTQKKLADDPELCPCCEQPKHAEGKPQSGKDWYEGEINKHHDATVKAAEARAGPPPLSKNAAKKLAGKIAGHEAKRDARLVSLRQLLADATARPGCVCTEPKPNILPSSPCDTFYEVQEDKTKRDDQGAAILDKWMKMKIAAWAQAPADRPPVLRTMTSADEAYMHKTPQVAGGCPTGEGNIQKKADLCGPCQAIDNRFNDFQGGWR
jgi:hypothetical protein